MPFLQWLEETGLALWVQENPWGYPVILSLHAIGMALLVGIVLMVNLRILGFAPLVPVPFLKPMMKVALWGFAVNVLSGTVLFMTSAVSFVRNGAFQIKFALLIVGGVLLVMLWRRLFPSGVQAAAAPGGVRAICVASMLAWLGVIVAGRLIAYVQTF